MNSSRTCSVEKWENPLSVRTHEEGWETRCFAGEKPKLTSACENYGLDNRSVVSILQDYSLDVSTPTLDLGAATYMS